MAWQKTGGVATLLEWDGNIPEFDVCHAELLKAKDYMSSLKKETSTSVNQEPVKQSEVSNPVHFMVNEASKAFIE